MNPSIGPQDPKIKWNRFIPRQAEDAPVKKPGLPEKPFMQPMPQKAEDEASPVDLLTNGAKHIGSNKKAITADSPEANAIFSEIEKIAESVGVADGSSLAGKEWILITTKDKGEVWVHFDAKNNELGFYEEKPNLAPFGKNSPYFHTFLDSQGEVVTKSYARLYSSYKVGNPDRLKDSAFAEQLNLLNKSSTPEEAKSTLLNYLKAKEVDLPSPEKAPLFYAKMDRLPPSKWTDILAIGLSLGGKVDQDTSNDVLDRYRFLSLLDETTKQLNDINLLDANKHLMIELGTKVAALRTIGADLAGKELLEEEEASAVVAVLEKSEATLEALKAALPKEKSFKEVEKPANQQIEIREPIVEDDDEDDVPVMDGVGAAPPPLADGKAAAPVGAPPPLLHTEEYTALKECERLCKRPETLAQGLVSLVKWIDKMKVGLLLNNEILEGVAQALPYLPSSALVGRPQDELNEIIKNTNLISAFLKESNFIKSAYTPELEIQNNTCYLSLALLGHLGCAALAAAKQKGSLKYPIEPFVNKLKLGFLLNDPKLQKKAELLAVEHYKSLGRGNQPLFNEFELDEIEEIKKKETKKAELKNVMLKKEPEPEPEPDLLLLELLELASSKLSDEQIKAQTLDAHQKFARTVDWTTGLSKLTRTFNQACSVIRQLVKKKAELETAINMQIKDTRARADSCPHELIQDFEEILKMTVALKSTNEGEKVYLKKIEAFNLKSANSTFKLDLTSFQDLRDQMKALRASKDALQGAVDKYEKLPLFKGKLAFAQKEYQTKDELENALDVLTELQKKLYEPLMPYTVGKPDSPRFMLALVNHPDPEKMVEALKTSAASVNVKLNPLLKPTPPKDEELTKFFLIANPDREKILGEQGQLIVNANQSSKAFQKLIAAYSLKEPKDPVTEVMTAQKGSLAESIGAVLDNSFKSSTPDGYVELDIKHSGYKKHLNANEVAIKYKNDSTVREFNEISCDKRDEAWKSLAYLGKHPTDLNEKEFYQGVYTHLFDFNTLGHLMHMERQGVNELISKGFPEKINQIIQSLRGGWDDTEASETKRLQHGTALATTLIMAAQLKDFLEGLNSEEKEKIDLSKYGMSLKAGEPPLDYRSYFFNVFGKNIDPSLLSTLDSQVFAELFLESLKPEDVVNPSLKEAITFYKADLDVRGRFSTQSSLNKFIENLVDETSLEYLDAYLHFYFVARQGTAKPQGLELDHEGYLNYEGKKSYYRIKNSSYFRFSIESLGASVDNPQGYLSNGRLTDALTRLLNKPLTSFIIEQDQDIYYVRGTPYSFNREGVIHIKIGNERLNYEDMDGREALEKFGLKHQFDPEKDHFFANPATGRVWIFREGKPQYRMGEQDGSKFLMRLKDNALCFQDKPGIWHTQSADNTYVPYSIEQGKPSAEYKFVTIDGTTRLESMKHPGFYISDAPATCQNVDLKASFLKYTVLQNEEGERILICPIAQGLTPTQWGEFRISGDRIFAEDPWSLLSLLLSVANPELILSHAPSLFLSSPRGDKQNDISAQLARRVATPPLPQDFGSWMALMILDRGIRGKEGGLASVDFEKASQLCKDYLAYTMQKQYMLNIRAPKEIERLFLNELRNWFDAYEAKLVKEIKERNTAQGGSFSQRVIRSLMSKIQPGDKEIELIKTRMLYKEFFSETLQARWKQLQFGEPPKIAKSWKIVNPKADPSKLQKGIDKLAQACAKEDGAWAPLLPIIPTKLVSKEQIESDEAPDKIAASIVKNFRKFKEVLESYKAAEGDETKQAFVNKNLAEFYHLAHSLQGEELKELQKWVDLVPQNQPSCQWIAKIARDPKRYLSMEKLIINNITHQRALQELDLLTPKGRERKRESIIQKYQDASASFLPILPTDLISQEQIESKSTVGKVAADIVKDFRTLDELLEDYDDHQKKESFVEEHRAEFYHLAHSVDGKERKTLQEWLAPVPQDKAVCKLIANVAKDPGSSPSMEKLIINSVEHRRALNEFDKRYPEMTPDEKQKVDKRYPDMTAEEKKQLKIEKKQAALTQKYNDSFHAHFSSSLWQKVSAVAHVIFTGIQLFFAGIAANKPLKLKLSPLSKPYAVFKRASVSTQERSAISDIDKSFNAFFKGWHDKLIDVTLLEKKEDVTNLTSTESTTISQAQADIEEYRGTIQDKSFALKSKQKLAENLEFQQFDRRLQKEITQCKTELKTLEQMLLLQANQAQDAIEQLSHRQKRAAIAWPDLVALVHKGQAYAYEKHLADPSQFSAIEEGFYKYLGIRTRLYQMERVSQTMSEIKQSPLDTPSAGSLQKLSEQLSETRSYTGAKRNDLKILFLEAASPKGMFKPAQYEKVTQLGQDPVQLAQMPTGFGKTDYIIPMINQRSKDVKEGAAFEKLSTTSPGKTKELPSKMKLKQGAIRTKQLIMNLWPGPLVGLNKAAIDKKVQASSGGEVQQLSFSRDSKLDSVQLEYMMLRLERAASKGVAISVRSSDVASLHLHWLETLEHLHEGKASIEIRKQAELYGKILNLLHTNSLATIDEAHDVLDPMQKTIYTLGSSKGVPEYAVDFASDLFGLLLEQDAFQEILAKNETLLPVEAEKKVDALFDKVLMKNLAALLHIPEKDHQKLKEFLQGKSPIDSSWPEKTHPQLYLAKGYFTVILKAGISGAVNEHFGLSKLYYKGTGGKSSYRFAIPYEKKDVPKENTENPTPSSYQNVDEILIKTLRTYHFSGLSKDNLVDLFAKLISNYELERQAAPNKPPADSPSYNQLMSLADKAGIPREKISAILKTNPDDRVSKLQGAFGDATVKTLTKDRVSVAQFVKQCVVPEIKIYQTSVDMTPQEMLKLFPQSVSLSATPQLPEVHSLRTRFVGLTGASGKTFDLLLSKTTAIKQMPKDEGPFIQGIVDGCKERNVRAVADPSGLKYFDRPFVEKMGKALSAGGSPIKYIVYFDNENGTLMRYDLASQGKQPFDAKSHLPKETLTLYDQARSTGTDIVQSADAKEILLVADATTVAQAGQGAGRMRQLDKGHTLEIWTTATPDPDLPLQEAMPKLLEKLILNGEQTSLQKNKVALQQLMMADLKGAMVRKMLGLPPGKEKGKPKPLDVDAMVRHYNKFRSELIGEYLYDPKTAYGSIGEAKTGKANLLSFYENVQEKAKKYFSGSEKEQLQSQLAAYPPVINNVPLPAIDYGVEVGASQELSTQQEVSAVSEASLQAESDQSIATDLEDQGAYDWKQKRDWPENPQALFTMEIKNPPTIRKLTRMKHIDRRMRALRSQKLSQATLASVVTNLKLKINTAKRSLAHKSFLKLDKENQTGNNVSFVSARSALMLHLPIQLRIGEKFFTDNLYLSSNFSDQTRSNSTPLMDAQNKKNFNQLLLVRDVDDQGKVTYKGIMIDAHDAGQLHKLLETDRNDPKSSSKTRQMAIINPDMGIIDQGKDALALNELKHPDVVALTAQAKLLSGQTKFSEEEKAYLKDKVKVIDSSGKKAAHKGKDVFFNLIKHLSPRDVQAKDPSAFSHLLI